MRRNVSIGEKISFFFEKMWLIFKLKLYRIHLMRQVKEEQRRLAV